MTGSPTWYHYHRVLFGNGADRKFSKVLQTAVFLMTRYGSTENAICWADKIFRQSIVKDAPFVLYWIISEPICETRSCYLPYRAENNPLLCKHLSHNMKLKLSR